MAKKKLEVDGLDSFDFDDGLDFDSELDFGFDQKGDGKSRTPIEKVLGGMKSGAKDAITDPSFIKTLVRASLPKTYGEITDAVGEVASGTYEIYDESVRELKPGLQRISKKIDQLIPENSKILKGLSDKLMALTGTYRDIDYGALQNQEEQAVTSALGAIFDQTQANEHSRDVKQTLRDRIGQKQFGVSANILNEIAKNTGMEARYTTSIADKYYRKSLELQIRSYMMQKDTSTATLRWQATSARQFEAIIRNTSLPEYTKITKSDRFMEKMKGQAASALFGNGEFVKAGVDRLKESLRNFISGAAFSLDQAEMGLDMAISGKEQMEQMAESFGPGASDELSKEALAGAFVADQVLSKVKDKVSGVLRKRTDKMPNLNEALAKGARYAQSPGALIEEIQNSDHWKKNLAGDGLMSKVYKAADWVGGHFKEEDPDRRINAGGNLSELGAPTMGFDNKAHTSLVDVIPGHLSAIHRELAMMRTGTDVPPRIYDFQRKEFVDDRTMGSRLRTDYETTVRNSSHNYYTGVLRDEFSKGKTLSVTESQELQDFFLRVAQIPNFTTEPDNIRKTAAYQSLTPAVKSVVDLQLLEMKHSETPEAHYKAVDSKLKAVRTSIPSMNDLFHKHITAGYGDLIAKEGLVTKDDQGNYKLNELAFARFLEENTPGRSSTEAKETATTPTPAGEPTVVTSDVNVKEKLRTLTPMQVIDAVKERFSTGERKQSKPLTKWYEPKSEPSASPSANTPWYGRIFQQNKEKVLRRHHDTADVKTTESTEAPDKAHSKHWSPKQAFDGIKNTKLYNWFYQTGKGDAIEHSGPMAQDVKRNLGEEAAPSGKVIDLQSMNGATMAAVQHVGERIEALEDIDQERDRVVRVLRLIKRDTLTIAQAIGSGAGGHGGMQGLGGMASPETYKEMTLQVLSGLLDMGDKALGDTASGARKLYTFGKDDVVKPMYRGARDFYYENKDEVFDYLKDKKDKAKAFVSESIRDVSSFFNAERDLYVEGGEKPVIYAHRLRAGEYYNLKTAKPFLTLNELLRSNGDIVDKDGNYVLTLEELMRGLYDDNGVRANTVAGNMSAWVTNTTGSFKDWANAKLKKLSGWFNEARDLYLPEGTQPIIQAVKLRLGYYRNAATGKVIQTMDELLACKDDIVDSVGNLVLSVEEKAEGLYDKHGEKVKSTLMSVGSAIAGAAVALKDRAVSNFKKLMEAAPGAFSKFKDKASGLFGDMSFGFGSDAVLKASFQVQSDIRDIMLGYNREVSKRLRKEGWKPAGLAKVIAALKPETKAKEGDPTHATDGSSASATGTPASPEVAAVKGVVASARKSVMGALASLEKLKPEALRAQWDALPPEQKKALEDAKGAVKQRVDKLKALATKTTEDGKPANLLSRVVGAVTTHAQKVFSKPVTEAEKPQASSPEEAKVEQPTAPDQSVPAPQASKTAKAPWYTRILPQKKEKALTKWYEPAEQASPEQATTPADLTKDIKNPAKRQRSLLDKTKLRAKATRRKFGRGFGRVGGVMSALGSLAGLASGSDSGAQEDTTAETEHAKEHAEGKEQGMTAQVKQKVTDATATDTDGDGQRDNGVADQAAKLDRLTESRKKKAAEADLTVRYKNETKASSLLDDISKLTGLITSGVGGLFGMAGTVFSKIPGLGKLFGAGKTVASAGAKAAGSILGLGGKTLVKGAFKGAGMYARGLWTAARFVVPMAASAIWSVSSAVLTGIAGVVFSAPVLGAAAIAAAGYGIWKLYQYATRDSVNDYEAIRLRQYGFNYNDNVKHFNHYVYGLEAYLLDNRVGYQSGQAYLNAKKIDPAEMLELFGIDKEDSETASAWTAWFEKRFKPVFLTHLTALFAQDPKVKLDDVTKLPYPKNVNYLKAALFAEGPYDYTTSPLKELPVLSSERQIIKDLTNALIQKKTAEGLEKAQTKGTSAPVPHALQKKAIAPTDSKEDRDRAEKAADQREAAMLKQSERNAAAAKATPHSGESDDGKAQASTTPVSQMPKIPSVLPTAQGGIYQGEGGMEFITLNTKGVNIQDLVPGVYKNFLGMSEEYGKLTGKSITVNSGVRSREQQAALYRKDPSKAAPPGRSLHEAGLALDIESADADKLEQLGLMRKYGFTRPVGQEPWHVEPAGIQRDLTLAKTDQSSRDAMIAASLLHGGGGYGTMPDAEKSRRNHQVAMALLSVGNKEVTAKPETEAVTTNDATLPKPAGETVTGPAANSPQFKGPQAVQTKTSFSSDMKTAEQRSLSNTVPTPAVVDARLNAANDSKTDNGTAWNNDVRTRATDLASLKALVADGARKVGVDPALAQAVVAMESDFDPNARAGATSGAGLYQFITGTWEDMLRNYGAKHGIARGTSPTDPNAAALMGPEYIKENTRALSSVQPNPSAVDLYLGHMLGASGLKRFLAADPDVEAARLFPEQASKNPPIFYGKNGRPKLVREIYSDITAKMKTKAAKYGINVSVQPTLSKSASQGTPESTGATPAPARTESLPKPSVQARNTSPQAVVENSSYASSARSGLYLDQRSVAQPPIQRKEAGQPPSTVNLTSIEGFLEKSVSLQKDSFEVLQSILENVKVEKVAEVLATAVGAAIKASEAKADSPKEQDKRNMNRFERTQASSLDLKRKAG